MAAQILRQQEWTDEELRAQGFQYYETIKRLTMAQVIRSTKNIEITLETLVAEAGDVMCYRPADQIMESLDEYEHWPVRRDVFVKNYRPWNEPNWQPTASEKHLMSRGCRPYFKAVGVWARRLRHSVMVQSLESPQPVLVPAGRWLCIGSHGEPYNMNNANFRSRYVVPPSSLRERLYWAAVSLRDL